LASRKAKKGVGGKPFFEISEAEPQARAELSEKNFLSYTVTQQTHE